MGTFEQKKNPSMPACVKITKGMKSTIEKLKDTVPLIRSLCNEGLMPRHKKNIFKALGQPPDQQELTDMNMQSLN